MENKKYMSVHEVAEFTGTTARTLHYYDEIGLLKPAMVTEAGYRQYSSENLLRLQEILFLREVGFALNANFPGSVILNRFFGYTKLGFSL